MKHTVDLNLNYFDPDAEMNDLIRTEFYAAKEALFAMGYEEYVEVVALPLDPKHQNLFYPLATYRVYDGQNYDTINIYQMALGGMIVTNEL